jgi:hypothetical protein
MRRRVMDCALICTWKMPFPGREKLAREFGVENVEFWDKIEAEGKCSEPEWFFFCGHGMWMAKGDPDTLWQIFQSDEAQRLIAKRNLVLEDIAWEFAKTGDAVTGHLVRYAEVGQELEFM